MWRSRNVVAVGTMPNNDHGEVSSRRKLRQSRRDYAASVPLRDRLQLDGIIAIVGLVLIVFGGLITFAGSANITPQRPPPILGTIFVAIGAAALILASVGASRDTIRSRRPRAWGDPEAIANNGGITE